MITEGITGVAMGIAAWIGTLFPPAPGIAQSMTGTRSMWSDFLASAVGLGAWVDWPIVLGIVGLVAAVYLAMFTVKLIRAVASYVPFVGGAG